MSEIKLVCPVCGGEMMTEGAMGLNFDIDDDPQGAFYTEWFAIIWECLKGCSIAEDWWFDDEHRDFNETATRNNQTTWYDRDGKEIQRDDEHLVRHMGG